MSAEQHLLIPADTEHRVFCMLGRVMGDERRLAIARRIHFQGTHPESPAYYLLHKYPLRPELRDNSRGGDQAAYQAGVMVGAVVLRTAMYDTGEWDGNSVRMPVSPADDVRVQRIKELAKHSRFWLQQFFATHDDVLEAVRREVETPLRDRAADLAPTGSDGGGDTPHDDYLVVGMGDILALSAVLAGGEQWPRTLPLEAAMA